MYYKDKIFSSMLGHQHVLKYHRSFDAQRINIFDEFSGDTLLTYMLSAQSKVTYPITYVKSIVIMRQIISAITHVHKRSIVHGNIRPSNVVFGTARNLHTLKLVGFENACLYSQSREIDEKFNEMIEGDDLITKLKIHKKVVVHTIPKWYAALLT